MEPRRCNPGFPAEHVFDADAGPDHLHLTAFYRPVVAARQRIKGNAPPEGPACSRKPRRMAQATRNKVRSFVRLSGAGLRASHFTLSCLQMVGAGSYNFRIGWVQRGRPRCQARSGARTPVVPNHLASLICASHSCCQPVWSGLKQRWRPPSVSPTDALAAQI